MKSARHVTGTRPIRLSVERLESRTLLAAGQLDPTFDGDGILFPTGFTAPGGTRAEAVAFAGGGKVLLAGAAGRTALDGDAVAAVARFNPDGTADATFGGDGWATVPLPGSAATAVAVQGDGKVVIGGTSTSTNFGLARFNTDGSLDTTFAGDGTYEFPLAGLGEVVTVLVLPDGDLLAGGGTGRWWVARVNPDGTPDGAFGNGGLAIIDPAADTTDRLNALSVDGNGKVLLAGTAAQQPVIARLTAGGAPDLSFSGDGIVSVPITGGGAYAVRALADGGIASAGSSVDGFWMGRFGNDGSPDVTFGAGGLVTEPNPPPPYTETLPGIAFESMEFTADGKVVAAGPSWNWTARFDYVVARRYNADGTRDVTFGTGGEVRTEVGTPVFAARLPRVADVAAGPDGEVAVAARAAWGAAPPVNEAPDEQAAVVRYTPEGRPDPAFAGGVATAPVLIPRTPQLTAVAESLDGKLVAAGSFAPGIVVARFNRDGSFDRSFDGDGWKVLAPRLRGGVSTLEVLPDGSMLVGLVPQSNLDPSQLRVLKLNPDGSLDQTFGVGGVAEMATGNWSLGVADLAMQPDGKIVAVGSFFDPSRGSLFGIARANPDGSRDLSFGGGDGFDVADPGPGVDFANAVAVLADGGILVGGYTTEEGATTRAVFAVMRYRPDGTPDGNFGNRFDRPGVSIIAPAEGGGLIEDLIPLAGGAFLAAGTVAFPTVSGGLDQDFVVARYTPNGLLDTQLSGDGLATAGFPSAGLNGTAQWIDRQPDGKLVVTGRAVGAFQAFAAARFFPDGTLDTGYGQGGRAVVQTGDGPSDTVLMSDGGLVFVGNTAGPLLVRLQGDPPAALSLVDRRVFYNDSAFDGGDPRLTPADVAAVAPDKQALRPGQTASFSNVTSYSKGINGIVVDLTGVPPAELLPGDFEFRAGRGGDPSAWAAAPAPVGLGLLPTPVGANATRYGITWAEGAVRNGWLRVTVKANARTGLAAPDVVYFGNLIGETGNAPNALVVNAIDLSGVRARQLQPADAGSPFDFNRDGRINAVDLGLCRANQLQNLPLLNPPAPATRNELLRRRRDLLS